MKTKLITGLALAAALLIGGPVLAQDVQNVQKPAVKGRAVAAARAPLAVHPALIQRRPLATGAVRSPAEITATRRTFSAPANQAAVSNRNAFVNRNGSGSTSNAAYARNGNSGRGRFAFASHQGWNHGSEYNWNGNHYRWYGNGWFVVNPYPYYGYGPGYAPGYNNNGGGPVSVQVQSALSQQGYYQGPIDGVVGPGTRAAISAYQQDNGLRVTGTITSGLLNNLGV